MNSIVQWIKEYCVSHNIQSLVVGVSGGIDSAVVAKLCEKTGIKTICISMPMAAADSSYNLAFELCQNMSVEFHVIAIERIVETYCAIHSNDPLSRSKYPHFIGDSQLRRGNIMARIRANILYDMAGARNGIVVGTTNNDEYQIGYFTKGGDGLVDIEPIQMLSKKEVYKLAAELNIPESIINAKPSANLWDGQTDEGEFGFTYEQLRAMLVTIEMNDEDSLTAEEQEICKKVKERIAKNRHKLLPIPYWTKGWMNK